MRNIAILLLLGAGIAGAAQNAPAAAQNAPATAQSAPAAASSAGVPPEVDAALRDRVAGFYRAQSNGKYRQADQYVAEDTKDYFYVMSKVPILKFEIQKIAYSDDFTKAVVTMRIERELAQAMMPKMKLSLHNSFDWKIENGLWCWTVDPSTAQTPFGPVRNPGTAPGGAQGAMPAPVVPNVADFSKSVAADKTEVELGERRTDQVVFRNSLPIPITLSLEAPETHELQVKLDHAEIAPNGAGRVMFAYDAPAGGATVEKMLMVNVTVQPTSQVISIRVKLKPVPGTGK
jgi:hypothetical protein